MTKAQLEDLVKRAAWTFGQAAVASFLTFAPGLLSAPNLSQAKALGLSALVGALGAGLSALKTYILTYHKS